ncbi:MAG: aldehyde dehydrogenase family protein, partial [Desulfuromonadales bacterium]|nr:aldehyde dehydrogenase family protein [Desulfuromonadales bacterium]NIR34299.1 aldehyde dehydrogenase family protein [Desulfuromonadales bacterium]NIS41743.1 aldehyde dehydrogenase family protein [Desulfuromonadales bacterium]
MEDILRELGIEQSNPGVGVGRRWLEGKGEPLVSVSPIDGTALGTVRRASLAEYEEVIDSAVRAFREWRQVPAPRRGEIVRQIGEAVREKKSALGALICLENGKLRAEGEGEVQEMIDICDLAVGQSRMLYGLAMHSERPRHRMYEQWHPLGPVGVITAFNFPVAVPAWNAMIALVAGDTVVWKPSHKVPLTSVALTR